jgi:hypothetical protein
MPAMSDIEEIAHGVLHWTALHPRIRQDVHSYYVEPAAAVLDPMVPDGVVGAIRERAGVERVLLTNRHHYRQADRLVSEFGCPVLCPTSGLHEFEGGPEVEGYGWGDEVAPGMIAHEVGAICPDDGALHIEAGGGLLAFADGLISHDGKLSFVPDFLMDAPEETKRGLVESFRRLLDLEFAGLLFAHGEPIVEAGRPALEDFVDSPHQASLEDLVGG